MTRQPYPKKKKKFDMATKFRRGKVYKEKEKLHNNYKWVFLFSFFVKTCWTSLSRGEEDDKDTLP